MWDSRDVVGWRVKFRCGGLDVGEVIYSRVVEIGIDGIDEDCINIL